MDKNQFLEFLEKNILPIFAGSEIVGEEQSSPRDAQVANAGGKLLVKLQKTDDYRIVIKKLQPFKNFEASLVKSIFTDLLDMYSKDVEKSQIEAVQNYIIEKSICESMSESASKTLLRIVTELTKWGNRTYEGNRTVFGFLVDSKKSSKGTNQNLHISKIMQEPFSAVLSDGINTCLEITSDGYLIKHVNLPKNFDDSLCVPYEYLSLAKCTTATKIGIALCKTGDILLFRDRELVFAKKAGEWVRYGHEEIIQKISNTDDEESSKTRRAVYLTALDVSFCRTGGCVVHLDKENYNNVLKHIDISDLLEEDCYKIKNEKRLTESFFTLNSNSESALNYEEYLKTENALKIVNMRKVINGRKFYELSRKFRQELVSIDGATIVDNDGNLLAVGAIILIESGGFSGGRLAAAKTLSKYGVSLKISADGQIQGFKMDSHKLRSIPIFMLG